MKSKIESEILQKVLEHTPVEYSVENQEGTKGLYVVKQGEFPNDEPRIILYEGQDNAIHALDFNRLMNLIDFYEQHKYD